MAYMGDVINLRDRLAARANAGDGARAHAPDGVSPHAPDGVSAHAPDGVSPHAPDGVSARAPGGVPVHGRDWARAAAGARAQFCFDLACPLSYLSGERVELTIGHVEWVPAAPLSPATRWRRSHAAFARGRAEALAGALRLPLIWPEDFPAARPLAMRAAAHAAQAGAGARFALAAGRLAFCGGFDIEDPEILAEAAAAAGIAPADALAASADPAYDAVLEATTARLRDDGVSRLPGLRIDGRWADGESAIARLIAMGPAVGVRAVDRFRPGAGAARQPLPRGGRAQGRAETAAPARGKGA